MARTGRLPGGPRSSRCRANADRRRSSRWRRRPGGPDRCLRRAGSGHRRAVARRGSCRGSYARCRCGEHRWGKARSADARSIQRQFRSVFWLCMATELRRDRREKQKRQKQRQQQRRRTSGGISNQIIVGVFVIGAIGLAILGANAAGVFQPPAAAFDLNSSEFQVPSGTTIGTQEPLLSAEHITPPAKGNYNTVPPTSGQHWIQTGVAPAPWGIKDTTLANEITTHNLEHGGIVIVYN